IRGIPGVAAVTDYNNYHELRLAENSNPHSILKQIIEIVPVRRFELVEPSLYDIFIDMAKIKPSDLEQPQEAVNG
ncbi:MAG: DUF4162 domain-containing protein, partial [Candidatus Zixiibacteriota bacterium]